MWKGGIRLAAGDHIPAEALIEAHPANMSIDIIVRGRDGSERACASLLHDLTDETIHKASEISPGSHLVLYYLSSAELNILSPAGLPSRPCVEYSEERVMRAIQLGKHVSDGKASSPENPRDLFPSPQQLQLARSDHLPSMPNEALNRPISNADWLVILLRLAKAINGFDECNGLARALSLNDRGEDMVKQMRELSRHSQPPEIAFNLFQRWFQGDGCQQLTTAEQRRAILHRVFRDELWRPDLCDFLDDELRGL